MNNNIIHFIHIIIIDTITITHFFLIIDTITITLKQIIVDTITNTEFS